MLSLSESDSSICVAGSYTPAFLMAFERQLLEKLKTLTQPKDLDLTNLVGSDSGLIAVLLTFQRVANAKHWKVKLIKPNEGIKGLIKLSQLEDFFNLSND